MNICETFSDTIQKPLIWNLNITFILDINFIYSNYAFLNLYYVMIMAQSDTFMG